MKEKNVRELIGILMESVFYLELPLIERYRLLKQLLESTE